MELKVSDGTKVWIEQLQKLNHLSMEVCKNAEEMFELALTSDEMKPFLDAVEEVQTAMISLMCRSIKENVDCLTITQV